jgi:predicted SprT family Zn-dependent metalloprotease
MIIKIKGKQDKMFNAELKFAVAFFAQYLLGTRLAKSLHMTISFAEQGDNTDGRCLPVDMFEKSPRVYYIGLKPGMSKAKILKVIAHEMVHLKQYVKRELSVGWKTASFKGETFKITESIEDYFNWPWEIEAFGRQDSLVFFYKCALKQEKVQFKRGRTYIGGKMIRKRMK